ncbi:MAG: hypothetical protein N3E52_00510 [Candidatus Bathyarchaeota archaeon]|nr:hypothetical protein [Candidatus Bathyarchaeota archaeon]
MYEEIYAAWRCEAESKALGSLPADFYARVTRYLQKIREESRMLDKKSVKATLLEHELQHARRMVKALVWLRYRKLLLIISKKQKVPAESLTPEETKLWTHFSAFAEEYQKFAERLLRGQFSTDKTPIPHKRVILRFLKDIPAIIGSDMKTYGPFLVEDIASVPAENAKILIKQGFAVPVEAS